MTWGKSVLLTIPLVLSGIFVVASPASAASDWTSASAGGTHSCGIQGSSGDLYCWGSDAKAQLGDGSGTSSSVTAKPKLINNGPSWTAVSAGVEHTCGIANGSLYCWGSDARGQVGNGSASTSNVDRPTRITSATDWKTVSAGYNHTCAIRSIGKLYCWGSDSYFQLGNGNAGSTTVPVQITTATSWKTVSAGNAHTCGIYGVGKLYCWGYDGHGQLGNATGGSTKVPAQITSATSWKTVSAGGAHTCGIYGVGKLYCWGYDGQGQLGNGNGGSTTAPVQITSATDWRTASAGHKHTCAIRTGELYCWGDNAHGQVMHFGTIGPFTSPVRFETYAGLSSDWKVGPAGLRHTCGIRGSGSLYCWGGSAPATFSPPGSRLPSAVEGITLQQWKLGIPTDGSDSGSAADEIKQPDLMNYQDPAFFHSSQDGEAIVFRARTDGATTSGSFYPRSELREVNTDDGSEVKWSNQSGTHTMTLTGAVTQLPATKPHVVAAQIHDGSNDVLQIRVEGATVRVTVDGYDGQVLDSNYPLGANFTIAIRADASGVEIDYDRGTVSSSYSAPMIADANTWYFKAGCYTQASSIVPIDDSKFGTGYGEVFIYDLAVEHS